MSSEQHRWILSGGLASGKSKVRELLAAGGVVTVDADSVGHSVIRSDGPAFDEVAETWPQVVHDGEIHRPSLAEVVFNDPDQLETLEAITHPHIMGTIRAQVAASSGPVVVEIPLLDHGLGEGWRRMVIDCRDDVRLARAVERGMTQQDALARMASQPSRSEWLAIADLVVPNHGTLDDLERTVQKVLEAL